MDAMSKCTDFNKLMSSAMESAEILKNLSHHLRLLAVCFIGTGEKTVQQIESHLGTSQSNISQHLAKLRAAKILETRKEGNLVYYRVKDMRTLDLVSSIQEIFCKADSEKEPTPGKNTIPLRIPRS